MWPEWGSSRCLQVQALTGRYCHPLLPPPLKPWGALRSWPAMGLQRLLLLP